MGLAVITGAGGFIGGHLTKALTEQGERVVAVDIKPLDEWHQVNLDTEANYVADMSVRENCFEILNDKVDTVYNLACRMGGIGFIETHLSECASSILINVNMLDAAVHYEIPRFFESSSACSYNIDKQQDPNVVALKETDAWPAKPEPGYGFQKLYSEELCKYYAHDYPIQTRIARFHNIYGPYGTYDGGKEKAPAAILRKAIQAKLSGVHEIEIWGDGEQTRTFCYIDDCVKGIQTITNGDYKDPVNLGSSELVSINQLVDLAEEIVDIKLKRTYNLDAPKGVRGRSSDNTLFHSLYGWEPSTSLREGLEKTYEWIFEEVKNAN